MRKAIAVAALFTALAATGCSKDFLTEQPKDFVGTTNFYRNATDAIAAVNAAYAGFENLPSAVGTNDDYYGRNFYMVTEFMTETMTNRLSAGNERSLIDNYAFASNHAYFLTIWNAAWFNVNKANAVIDHVPGIEMPDTTIRTRVVGEAKFLRATHYFNLVRFWGGVPIKQHETASLDSLSFTRATTKATYDFIIQDLKDAAAVLPVSYSSADYGRATKGAALALLGKVYLQEAATGIDPSAYQPALDAFKQVMALGVYQLDSNYGSLFDGTNEGSKEIIFAIQNIRVDGLGGRLSKWNAPTKYTDIPGPQNAFQIEMPFYNGWTATDKRKAASILLSYVNAGKTVPWVDPATTSSVSAYGSSGPTPRKFIDLGSQGSGSEGIDYPLIRYADVLLSAAEAIDAISGPTTEAYGYVNAVRTRAGLAALATGLSAQDFKNAVFLERRYEFWDEGMGYFDSQRNWDWAQGRVYDNMKLGPTLNKKPLDSSVPKAINDPTQAKFKLLPIPSRAIELNQQLQQNPGW